jgi:predicted ATPase/class 3 adenylate cyclase
VLFCDLVDSTALASQLDPEDLREVVRAYQSACGEVIQRFEGYIAQYLGDGLLVYFGYPQAHEDDAQRAVRTGLGVLDTLGDLNARLEQQYQVRVALRIGIHTGLVVVGEMGSGGRQEQLALGETPNIAARLQGLAAPNTVVISATTHRLVQGYFTCDDRGLHRLKGVETPTPVYRVVGESTAQSRLDVAGATGLTPLVGREHEVGLLRERWAQSQDGQGQVVQLSGEAGIGKSRLVHVLIERVVDAGAPCLTLRCSPYHTHSAFYPVIEHLQRLLQWHRGTTPEARLATLEQALRTAGLPLEGVVPLLATLLTVPVPEQYPLLTLSPQRHKQKTQEALVAWLLAEAAQRPMLAVWEDLHWADPSTLELLERLLDQVPTARLLLVLTARPGFRPHWRSRSFVTSLTLTHLTRPQVEEMVLRVTGGKPVPAEVLAQVVAKIDGIPLFVEELVKTILESGLVQEEADRYELTGPLPPLAIPATLHDSLMARLDRLATVKEVAQWGATLGRAFPYELLQAVAPWDDATLQHALARLVEAELLYQRGLPPAATYLFKHALIQETAYQSLLRSRRQQAHQRIAQVLEEQFPDTAQTQPELLAHHYTEAGLTEQAIPYWQRAGQRAVERSAHVEAISHLTRALELLRTLPDTPARAQQELTLQHTLGVPLLSTKGWAAPDVEQVYARAYALCQQVGDTREIFPVHFGLCGFHEVRGNFLTGCELAEQLLTLAQRHHDPALLLHGHRALGENLYMRGELVSARARLEQGIALYDPQQHRAHAFLYGHDSGMACRVYAAQVLWLLGYPEQALQRSHEALTLARELSHPFSLAFVLNFAVRIHRLRREWQASQAHAEALLALATEQGFAYWVAIGTMNRGAALAAQGQGETEIAEIRQGLADWRATGAELGWPSLLAMLATAYGDVGQPAAGLPLLDEALAVGDKNDERFYEAELYRLKGELLLALSADHQAEAAACYHQALTIACHQQARSWELRAAMSLSRLWQQQGKCKEAHDLLAPIYGWLTEGFDTADLQEAKALLQELS